MAAGGQRRRVRGRSPPSLPHTLPLGTVGRGPGSARFPPGVTAAEGGPEGGERVALRGAEPPHAPLPLSLWSTAGGCRAADGSMAAPAVSPV